MAIFNRFYPKFLDMASGVSDNNMLFLRQDGLAASEDMEHSRQGLVHLDRVPLPFFPSSVIN